MKPTHLSISLYFLLIFLIQFIYCGYYPNDTCKYPNDCKSVKNKPYCLGGYCRVCNPDRFLKDCDCHPGEYCVGTPDDVDYATCRKYEKEIIDRNCDVTLKDKGMKLIQGANDTIFCGKVLFYRNSTAKYVEWEGSCQLGKCQECSIAPIPTLPFAYCNDGRSCLSNKKLDYAPVGIFSLGYLRYNVFFVSFYVVAFFIFIAAFIIVMGAIALIYYYYLAQKLKKVE
eukprot:TRINITY_DN5232_c0_g1_i1.p1 TRINITY_DN5232_c0_g1~~TRINITY_DN5232_c0_g1_i1.p1  ORF type:complete len:227 (+),score=51.54 TRINITY_DN5232_c0_g1_i1:42-722(+)